MVGTDLGDLNPSAIVVLGRYTKRTKDDLIPANGCMWFWWFRGATF